MDVLIKTLAIGMAPVAFLFTYIYLQDKYEREPLKYLVGSFLLGMGISIPAIYLEVNLPAMIGVAPGRDFFQTLIIAMVVIAFAEEMLKYLVLRLYMYNKREFDEPFDGIVYAVAVSLGFAAVENILYITKFGLGIGFARMITAVPLHAMVGVLMGYFVGLAKFNKEPSRAWIHQMKGLLAAVVVHGLYDFFLMWKTVGVAILSPVVLVLAVVLAVKSIRIHQKLSPYRSINP